MKIYNNKKLKEILLRGSIILCTATVALTAVNILIDDESESPTNIDTKATEYIQELNNEDTYAYFCASNVTVKDLLKIPSTINDLYFWNCHYINSLSILPNTHPNLTDLEISNCSSVINLDFIYELKNLKNLKISNCVGVTQELVDYLNNKGVNHNITKEDIEIANKIENICNEIIDENMTNEEKIQAISVYVFKNYKYNLDYCEESNREPLKCMLNNKEGVCYGYAYLTEVLLSKAGIDSSIILSSNHAWNLVKEDDKYYYLDVTNMETSFLPEYFNFGFNYMVSPTVEYGNCVFSYDTEGGKILIPKEIIKEIETSEDTKSIMDKYFTGTIGTTLKCILPLLGIALAVSGTKFTIKKTTETIETEKRKRKLKKQRKFEAKKIKEEQIQQKKEMKIQQKELKRKEKLKISNQQQFKVINLKKEKPIDNNSQEEIMIDTPKEPEVIRKEQKKELSAYELMIKDMYDSFCKYKDFRSVLFSDYNFYLINNEYITFVEYLKSNKRYNTNNLVVYEEKKINIINKVYQEFINFYKNYEYDLQLFINYCKNRSKLINDLGGLDLIIYTSDLEMFIENLTRTNTIENKEQKI